MVIHFKCDFGNNIDFYWYCFFFFFKQKTAYEILGDWSSDVCSSDLIFVEGAHGGSFAGNTIHDNCAGMIFEALPSTPGGEFEVKGNTVVNNSRSCRASQFGTNFSEIGRASCRERV